MFLKFIILIVGFVFLIKGADIFVDGSAALAGIFRIPGLIIGLTIVALGTSVPELAVSVSAAIQGSNEIALSNVVGSNIFNMLVVLGSCAVFHPVPVEKSTLKRDFPVAIVSTVFVLAVTGFSAIFGGKLLSRKMTDNAGIVSRVIGGILIAAFIGYIVSLVIDARKHPMEEKNEETRPLWKCILLIIIGIVCVVAGGKAVVYGAREIAAAFGMSETLIGLTIVAAGTSLPELVTSIAAARKNEAGLAVGNAIGSNIFNLMFILGVSAVINPVAVNIASVYDMIVLIAISVMTWIFAVRGKSVNRAEGITMMLVYAVYVAFAIMR